MSTRIEGDLVVTGTIRHGGLAPPLERSDLAVEDNSVFPVPLVDARVWDAIATVLPGTSATDDLAFDGGTFGTSGPTIRTSDLKAVGVLTTRYARFPNLVIPDNYSAGQTITLRISGGMITTAADASATVDVEAYRIDKDNTIGADICTTAAQSINNTTFANKDFTITPTSLGPGDLLDVRIAIAVNDASTLTAVIGAIASIDLLVDTKG